MAITQTASRKEFSHSPTMLDCVSFFAPRPTMPAPAPSLSAYWPVTSPRVSRYCLAPRRFTTWKGALKQQAEVQLLIKSCMALRQAVFTHIKAHHPYQTPELLVLPVTGSDHDYLLWLNDSLR